MPDKSFEQGILYHLNFMPAVTIMTLLLAAVYFLPSSNKQPGYLFVSALSALCFCGWFLEKRKVAHRISVTDETIVAFGFFKKSLSIPWKDIDHLSLSGKRLFIFSGKMQKFLYAEVISKNNQKIAIRRDICNFTELTELIESKAQKTFEAKQF